MANTQNALDGLKIKKTKIKGNPAHHRMDNARRKLRRAKCWERGQAKKSRNRDAQLLRELHNTELRSAGLPTPWEVAKALRAKARG